MSKSVVQPFNSIKYVVGSTTLSEGKKTLQMQSIQFTIITPGPTQTPLENSPAQTQGKTCVDKPSNPANLQAIINDVKTKYGIILSGDSSLTVGKANLVFSTMCKLFTSQIYITNLNSVKTITTPNPHPIYLKFTNQNHCFAWTKVYPFVKTVND